jgi:hypothetical protein
MTFLAAAQAVLKSADRPLTTREVVTLAMDSGLIQPGGTTPVATMRARLYQAVSTDPDGPIRREFVPGAKRAVQFSVRWSWRAN